MKGGKGKGVKGESRPLRQNGILPFPLLPAL
jgi:hypothetical protein